VQKTTPNHAAPADEALADLCPRCARVGYLLHIDLRQAVKSMECRECRVDWVVEIAKDGPKRESPKARRLTLTEMLERAELERNRARSG
jgi:hypothetical protein